METSTYSEESNPTHYILEKDMMFAIGLSINASPAVYKQTHLFMYVSGYELDPETNEFKYFSKNIPLIDCNSSMFDPDIYKVHHTRIDGALCPANISEVYVQGYAGKDRTAYIELYIKTNLCDTWLSMEEYYDQLKYADLRLFTQMTYVDFSDIDNPVKIKGVRDHLTVLKQAMSRLDIKIRENNYDIENSFIYSTYDKGRFYSFDQSITSTGTDLALTDNGWMGVIRIMFDDIQTNYNVKIYNFYDLLAQLGGIYEILYELLAIFALYVTRKMYEHSLVNTMNKHMQKADRDYSSSRDNLDNSQIDESPDLPDKNLFTVKPQSRNGKI